MFGFWQYLSWGTREDHVGAARQPPRLHHPAVACLGRGRGTTPTSGLGDDACVDRLDRADQARERADRARRRSAELADRVTELQQGAGATTETLERAQQAARRSLDSAVEESSAPPRDSSGPRTPTNGRRTSWSGGPRMSARDARTSCVERGRTARRPPRTVRKRSATEPPPRRCVPPLADPVRAPRRDRRPSAACAARGPRRGPPMIPSTEVDSAGVLPSLLLPPVPSAGRSEGSI
jgi:hypothetical protein